MFHKNISLWLEIIPHKQCVKSVTPPFFGTGQQTLLSQFLYSRTKNLLWDEVLKAVTVNTIVLWDVTLVVSQIGINVPEERAASIFSLDILKMEARNTTKLYSITSQMMIILTAFICLNWCIPESTKDFIRNNTTS